MPLPFLRPFLMIITAAVSVGCGPASKPVVPAEPPPVVVEPVVEAVVAPEVVAEPDPNVFRPELLPQDLEGVIGFKDFEAKAEKGIVSTAVSVLNLSATEPIILELAAEFYGEEERLLGTTEWSMARIRPLARHQFYSETSNPAARSGRIILRKVTEKAP